MDEAFLDVTENKPGIPLAIDIAREIKQRIREELGLVASAGISYNKFLAKIASDYRKPDGLCTIHPDKALDFIAALPIESFWGVGRVTAKKMRSLGIYNGYTLRQWSLEGLRKTFGKMGEVYYSFARGVDLRPVEPTYVRKSVGCEFTFEKDISTQAAVVIELYHVAEELIRQINPEAKIVTDTDRLRPEKSEVNRLLGTAKELNKLTGWKPNYTFEEGIAETIEWFRHNLSSYKTDIYNI